MSHKTQTVVKHWLDLDEREQFDVANWNGTPHRLVRLYAEVTDGSLSKVTGTASRILTSGALGASATVHFWSNNPNLARVHEVLRAHGITTPERSR